MQKVSLSQFYKGENQLEYWAEISRHCSSGPVPKNPSAKWKDTAMKLFHTYLLKNLVVKFIVQVVMCLHNLNKNHLHLDPQSPDVCIDYQVLKNF